MSESKIRIMGELVFVFSNAKHDAAAAGAKLRAAGFEFKITDDIDECSDDTRYMMVWRDYHADALGAGEPALADQFTKQVGEIVGNDLPDCVGLVAPDFVPKFFGDFGRPAAA
jgi:hypothetical protein